MKVNRSQLWTTQALDRSSSLRCESSGWLCFQLEKSRFLWFRELSLTSSSWMLNESTKKLFFLLLLLAARGVACLINFLARGSELWVIRWSVDLWPRLRFINKLSFLRLIILSQGRLIVSSVKHPFANFSFSSCARLPTRASSTHSFPSYLSTISMFTYRNSFRRSRARERISLLLYGKQIQSVEQRSASEIPRGCIRCFPKNSEAFRDVLAVGSCELSPWLTPKTQSTRNDDGGRFFFLSPALN